MRYAFTRAKTRAIAVSTGVALVVVPLTGAAAVAITGSQPAVSQADKVALAGTSFAAEIEQIGEPVIADASATFTVAVPALEVTKDAPPPPPPSAVRSGGSTARAVANSADVSQAIAGSSIIAEASKYVGTAYVSGGGSPSEGFDCSGFTSYVYAQFGISLPTSSGAYWNIGTKVDSPQPGDIIVSSGHVGIYAGPNLQIDAPRPGKTVQFRSIWQTNPTYIRVTG